jgi:hypothetical protein
VRRYSIFFAAATLGLTFAAAAHARDIVYSGSTKHWTLTFSGTELIFRERDGASHEDWQGEAWRTASSRSGVTYSGFFTRYFIAAGEQGNRRYPFELTLQKCPCQDRQGRKGSVRMRIRFYPDADGFTEDERLGCGSILPEATYLLNPILN